MTSERCTLRFRPRRVTENASRSNLLGGGHHRRRGLAGREEQAAGHRHGDGAEGVDPQRAPGVAGAVQGGLEGD